MFQFRIGGVNSNSFYLSSRGEDARYVFDQLVEHTEDDEMNEKSKGIYIVDRDAAHAAMMWSMVKGELPAEKDSHRAEASEEEIESVARMWLDANGILGMAEEAMEDGKDLILEVWYTDEKWASQKDRIMVDRRFRYYGR
jgi:murein endopeptidase